MCRREAMRFYYEPLMRRAPRSGGGGGGDGRRVATCSTLVEAFAFPENEEMPPENVDKSDRNRCRSIVHELAQCLSRHKVGQR